VTSFGMDVVSDLKDTTMELRKLSMDAPEQLKERSRNYSNDCPDVIQNLLPSTMDCIGGCGNACLPPEDEQLELTVHITEEHVIHSEETSPRAGLSFHTTTHARWTAAVSHAKIPSAEAVEDFTDAAGPYQNGNDDKVTTRHHKEPGDAAFKEFAKDNFWWARPSVSFLDQGTLCSHSSSTRAGESPTPSVRGISPAWSTIQTPVQTPIQTPIQTPREARTLVNLHITGSTFSSWESIDAYTTSSAALPL